MKNLSLLLFFCSLSVVVNAQTQTAKFYGMVAGDKEVDNAKAFLAAVKDHKDGKLERLVLNGHYNFDTPVHIEGANGLTIEGSGRHRSTLFTDNLFSILVNNNPSYNITLKNIKFEATTPASKTDLKGNDSALLYLTRATSARNWLIDNCEFTAPNAITNGIKVHTSAKDSVYGITIKNSHFHDLGRMGAETVNHKQPLKVSRIRNIVFESNLVQRTGLLRYGMGVSLSGRNEDCLVRNNTFMDNPTCAVEIVGNKNTIIENNIMNGSGSAINIVDGAGISNDAIHMKCNTANVEIGNIFMNATGIKSERNIWISETKSYFKGVDGFLSNGDKIKASKIAVFQIFGSEKRPTRNIRFDNAVLESLDNVPIVKYTKTKGPVENIAVNCSELRIPKGNDFGTIDYGNTTRFTNNKKLDVKKDVASKCLPVSHLDAPENKE